MGNLWLIAYLLCWGTAFLLYQRRKRLFDAESLLLLLYTIYAFVSLLLYNNPDFEEKFKPIQIFPFIYLFIMIWMAKSSVRQYCIGHIDKIIKPNKSLFIVIALFFVIPSLIHLPGSISNIGIGVTKLLLDSSEMSSMYAEAMEKSETSGTGDISNLSAIISSAFYDVGVLLTFYYLTLNKRNRFMSVALVLSCLIGLLSSVSLGQRGAIVSRALTLALTFVLLKPYYGRKIKRVLGVFATVLAISLVLLLGIMTYGRFLGEESGAIGSSEYYVGQANLYFNNYGLDNNGYRYGDRVMPLFKRIIGFNNVPHNFWERRDKYSQLKIDDEVFCTFVGDFTIDFGPIIAFVLFVVFSAVFLSATKAKHKCIFFYQLILVHWAGCVCVQGGMTLFSMSDIGGNLEIIVYLMVYFVFKFSYISSKRVAINTTK